MFIQLLFHFWLRGGNNESGNVWSLKDCVIGRKYCPAHLRHSVRLQSIAFLKEPDWVRTGNFVVFWPALKRHYCCYIMNCKIFLLAK